MAGTSDPLIVLDQVPVFVVNRISDHELCKETCHGASHSCLRRRYDHQVVSVLLPTSETPSQGTAVT